MLRWNTQPQGRKLYRKKSRPNRKKMMKKLEILKTNRTGISVESVWASSAWEDGDKWSLTGPLAGWGRGITELSGQESKEATLRIGEIAQGKSGITKAGVCWKGMTFWIVGVWQASLEIPNQNKWSEFVASFSLIERHLGQLRDWKTRSITVSSNGCWEKWKLRSIQVTSGSFSHTLGVTFMSN